MSVISSKRLAEIFLGRHLFVPSPPPSIFELWFFAHHDHARHAGFIGHRHRQDRNMICYTVKGGCPDDLRGYRLGKVVVTEFASKYVAYDASPREIETFKEALHLARSYLRYEPEAWIEL